MAGASPARRAALAVRLRCQHAEGEGRDVRVRDELRRAPELSGLPERDRALATLLATSATRTRGAADIVVQAHLRRGRRPADLEPAVREVLRLATCELLWLGHPAHVAVSQGVSLVRERRPEAAGLANAVLRAVATEDLPRMVAARERLALGEAGDALVDDAKLVGALPAWLAWELGQSMGEDAAARLALGALEPPLATAAANQAALAAGDPLALLAREGVACAGGPLPASLVLGGYAGLSESPLVASGAVVPADLAAQLVALVACPDRGGRLLEVGQGRATKSLLLESAAALRGVDLSVEGVELDGRKVSEARRRLGAAGLQGRVACHALDGRALAVEEGLPPELLGPFDTVLVDAPCTGTGTMRRHPEIPWRLRRDDADGALPRLQLELLEAASHRVAPGGDLLYSTCSELAQENEGVVRAFLAGEAGRGFSVARIEPEGTLAKVSAPMVTGEGFLRTSRGTLGCDGHFLARLVRRG